VNPKPNRGIEGKKKEKRLSTVAKKYESSRGENIKLCLPKAESRGALKIKGGKSEGSGRK